MSNQSRAPWTQALIFFERSTLVPKLVTEEKDIDALLGVLGYIVDYAIRDRCKTL